MALLEHSDLDATARLEGIRFLDGTPFLVAGRTYFQMLVGPIPDGALTTCQRDQNVSRRAADALGIRVRARHEFLEQRRGEGSRKPEALARTLLANLPQLVDALENGSSKSD